MKPSPATTARGTDVGGDGGQAPSGHPAADSAAGARDRPRWTNTIPGRFPMCRNRTPWRLRPRRVPVSPRSSRGYWEHHLLPTRDCALDVANEGARTLDEVAAVLGVSGERVRQIEERAIAQLMNNVVLKRLHDELEE